MITHDRSTDSALVGPGPSNTAVHISHLPCPSGRVELSFPKLEPPTGSADAEPGDSIISTSKSAMQTKETGQGWGPRQNSSKEAGLCCSTHHGPAPIQFRISWACLPACLSPQASGPSPGILPALCRSGAHDSRVLPVSHHRAPAGHSNSYVRWVKQVGPPLLCLLSRAPKS